VVEALSCAVAMQGGLAKRNQDIPAEKRIEFRIGVNIGDVIVENGDVFGDGVNIAARLEQVALPGGICLSEDAYRQVRGKLDIPMADAGEQQLKNIASPVRIYRIEPSAAAGFEAPPRPAEPKQWRSPAMIAAVAIAGVIAVGVVAWFGLQSGGALFPERAESSKPLVVGAMPVIAVLPFANQSADDSQDYFADGVTEEVINALGRFNTLRVIGRNAVLRYKNRPPTSEEISSELGANYLVAGSVRHAGNRVRVAAQLADAHAGTVMWSDRYDGELTDIFEFQDTIARQIAGTLAVNITLVEGRRQIDHPRPNPTAFDLVLRARAIGHSASRTTNRQFRELVGKAIELDPTYATAHALFADALRSLVILGWAEFPERELSRSVAEAQKAISLASNEPDGYRALGRVLLDRAEYDQAKNVLKRAMEINPSDATALATWGAAQSFTGDSAGAITSLEFALKLDPMMEPSQMFDLAVAYYLSRRNEDALRIAERGLTRYPDFSMFNAAAAAAAARLGRKEQAAAYVEALRQRVPFLDLDTLGSRFRDPSHSAYLRDGLKLAGF
jgi:TolB-like protein/Tfp pilus assembly protein PilF